MDSKSDRSDPSADGSAYEHPVDSCNHLISTSLRDLNLTYKNLSSEQADSPEANKNKSAEIEQGADQA